MPSAVRNAPPDSPAPDSRPAENSSAALDPYRLSEGAARREGRNFLVIALFQIILRTGWIFKTESIIMPAVLDTITGGGPLGGLLRGCLPVLNRLGHSIPPMLFSQRLKMLRRKRVANLVCVLCMSAVFFALALMFWATGGASYWWMPVVFLTCYVLFFAATGINNIALGTLQGKLIHATRRGRLLLTANVIGAATAITAVALLMPHWLNEDVRRFDLLFGFTATCFAVSALSMCLISEPKDRHQEARQSPRHLLRAAWNTFWTDRNFGRLALVAMAFSTSLVLFPHYQALGRSDRLGLPLDNLMLWVIVQNFGTAVFSLITGPLADRFGNRLVLRIVLLGVAAMPPAAIGLSYWDGWGAFLYPGVFMFIGLTPVGFKTISNFTLEIAPHDEHPKYLSTLGLCFALPLLASPALGWVVEATNFEIVFFSVSAIVLLGWLLTFRLHEPRHGYTDDLVGGLPEGS